MSAISKIEWTDRTWNPIRGCSIVSPGCVNCYAMKQGHRFSGRGKAYDGLTKQTKVGPQWTGKVRLVEDALTEPLSWKKPSRVFVNSMADLFHESVPGWFVAEVFATMALAPQHTFQILTKRAHRMRDYLAAPGVAADVAVAVFKRFSRARDSDVRSRQAVKIWPLPNVWLGISCEDQPRADERIPHLLQTPAAVRFISAEPLLGPIDLNGLPDPKGDPSWDASALLGIRECAFGATVSRESIDKLDWVIVGGESGSNARVSDLDWYRSIAAQCRESQTALFMKQLGAYPVVGLREDMVGHHPTHKTAPSVGRAFARGAFGDRLKLIDRKGGDPNEWPEDLRVREFPAVSA